MVGEVVASTREEIDHAVQHANQAQITWKNIGVTTRINLLKKALTIFQSKQDQISSLINKEIGTPTAEVQGEVSWDWDYWKWFVENVEKSINPETTYESDNSIHQVVYEPIGTVAVLTPWNLPFDMFLWGVIPNLLVGNTVVYKAVEECALSGKLYSDILNEAGLPVGVFNSINGDGAEGEYLVNAQIDAVWFTGSTEVGQKIFTTTGKKFIRSMLEMGGPNPVIVCADADLELAAKKIISKRFMFSGQTCDADKRLIVHSSIKDQLVQLLIAKIKELPITPVASAKQLDLISEQVKDSIANGAKVLIGGEMAKDKKGAFYLPTLLDNIKPSMRVWCEEVFGPVLPIMTFETKEYTEPQNLHNGLRSNLYGSTTLAEATSASFQSQSCNRSYQRGQDCY